MQGRVRSVVVFALALVALVVAVAPGGAAAGDDENAVISPLGMSIEDAPNPVRGADGLFHLAYEITIVNQSSLDVTIDSVQARFAGKAVGAKLLGPDLNGLLRVNGPGSPDSVIPAGGSALLFMDVTYERKQDTPKRLVHRFTMTGV